MAKKSAKKTPAFVGTAEFEAFKQDVSAGQKAILDMLEKAVAPKTDGDVGKTGEKEAVKDLVDVNVSANGMLPAQYQKVFEKYFDPADGFHASLMFPEIDEKGRESGGITFTISVPMKFSNTDDGYRKMYKQDLRSRALLPHSIAKGIEEYCKAVVNNLKYDKNIKTK